MVKLQTNSSKDSYTNGRLQQLRRVRLVARVQIASAHPQGYVYPPAPLVSSLVLMGVVLASLAAIHALALLTVVCPSMTPAQFQQNGTHVQAPATIELSRTPPAHCVAARPTVPSMGSVSVLATLDLSRVPLEPARCARSSCRQAI